ncbi:hypothetical protein ADIWIN_1549 [Winogradskyella psychrotolerans RS-3]|uniref:Uncharacterized protein n=1 Tax=Winogradskyella psychrotolerans RS-3 TaxID=641526 RepID=S7X3B6_9FLAO|nr:hypothetical protein ADIWIN_1549 [Winogradskyella psychrotolerans RS-3]
MNKSPLIIGRANRLKKDGSMLHNLTTKKAFGVNYQRLQIIV